MLFTSMTVHGFVPEDFQVSNLTISKGKNANLMDSGNYRATTLSCILANGFIQKLVSAR